MKRVFKYIVEEQFNNERLDSVLRTYYKISGSLIKELKRTEDGLLINGNHARTVDSVHTNDEITVTMYDEASENIVPVKLPFTVIYEDEDIIIVSKPPFMPTHPSMDNFNNTLANGLMYYFRERGEEHTFRAVNRLDKDTSGLMCVAKNRYIHARLSADFKTKAVKRKYRAIVCGTIAEDGTVDAPIARKDGSAIERCVREDGQRAVTHYKVIKNFDDYTLIELELETGRTHQIRVHMAYIGHPLLGDWLYGEEDKELFGRQALHSCYLCLTHPVTGEKLEFFRDIPQDMSDFMIH